jgi:DNA repair protein RadC
MGLKEAYQERIEAQLREWNARINELKARAAIAKADAKIDLYNRIDILRAKLEAAQAKLQELKQIGAEKWDEIRLALDKDMDYLKTTWESSLLQRELYLEAQLKEWATKINEITDKAQQAAADVKPRMLEEINEMRDLKDEVKRKLTDFKAVGGEKWKRLEANTERGLDELRKRWDDFKAKYL